MQKAEEKCFGNAISIAKEDYEERNFGKNSR